MADFTVPWITGGGDGVETEEQNGRNGAKRRRWEEERRRRAKTISFPRF